MPTTPNADLTYPLDSAPANLIGTYIQALAEDVDDRLWLPDLAANRPAAGKKGRRFYATDTGDLSLDTGSTWVLTSCTAVRQFGQGAAAAVNSTGSKYLDISTSGIVREVGPAGLFTVVTFATGEAIEVAADGWYRATAEFSLTPGGGVTGRAMCKLVSTTDGVAVARQTVDFDSEVEHVTTSYVLQVDAGGEIVPTVEIVSTSGTVDLRVERMIVERVGA